MTYNVHKGFAAGMRRDFVLHELREAVCALEPDVLLLQEVQGEHTGHRDRLRESWPELSHHLFLAGDRWRHHVYGGNAHYAEGHHGNAILSRFPILRAENEDISTGGLERRGVLHAVVRPFYEQPELHLVSTHFGLFGGDRKLQAGKFCARLRGHVRYGHGIVAGGDFNDWGLRLTPIFEAELGLREAHRFHHGRHARTFPARMPLLALDRIYFRGVSVRKVECLTGNPWARLSDHAPILAEFEST